VLLQVVVPIGPMPRDTFDAYLEALNVHRHVSNILDPVDASAAITLSHMDDPARSALCSWLTMHAVARLPSPQRWLTRMAARLQQGDLKLASNLRLGGSPAAA